MGKRGPKRTPTLELLRRGSYRGKRRAAEELAVEPAEDLTMPANLDPEAKPIWERVVKQLQASGTIGSTDLESLYAYVEACAEFDKAVKELRKGYLYKSASGEVRKSPWIAIKRDAAARIKQFAAEFGLTPASRSNVRIDNGRKKKEDGRPKATDFIKLPGTQVG